MEQEKKINNDPADDISHNESHIDNKDQDREINFGKNKMIYGSNEYGESSSELCRSNENEYGRTDYDERARKQLIRNSPDKNVMSSNTGMRTDKIESADSIILKLSAEDIDDQLKKKRGESTESSDEERDRGESGEDTDLNERGESK